MKTTIFTFVLFFSIISFSQNQKGFTIISNDNIVIANSDHFALTSGDKGSKLKQTNTFCFSFKDSTLVHVAGAYKNKEGKHEMMSQVYKITNIEAVVDRNGVDLFLITSESGLSGKSYDYYIEFNGSDIHMTQIFTMTGNKDEGFEYGGVLYNNLAYCVIRPYKN